MLAAESYVINNPKVVQEMIQGESVIVNLETGVSYSLTHSAAAIWHLIDEKANTIQIVDHLLSRYEGSREEIEEGLNEFLADLKKESLVEQARANYAASLFDEGQEIWESPVQKLPFEAPKLERYSEMRDSEIFDAMHEIEGEGINE